jgi:phosphatidylserine/phosphatidylglycerophosphate/cardiolipin synthase-like enzyme
LRPVRYSAFGQATLGDIAERAFARAAGGAAIAGNAVRLLCDARENFPAWREALANAQKYILFEQYIVENDDIGREFTQLLADRARAGVKVYAIVDWLGAGAACRCGEASAKQAPTSRLQSAPALESARMAVARPSEDDRRRR